MDRRRLLYTLVASTPIAGCIRIDSQVSEVPIWVENHGSREYEVAVEWIDESRGEAFVSTGVTLEPGERESIYAEPIEEGGEYVVTVTVGDHTERAEISGGRLRDVTADIHAEDDIQIARVDS